MPPPRLPLIGLRTWLLSLVLASMAPFLMFAASTGIAFGQTMRTAILEDLSLRARSLQQATEQSIDLAAAEIGGLAESESAQSGDWPGLYSHAKRLVERDRLIRAVTLVDPDKRVVLFTSVPFGSPAFAANDPESVDAVLQTGRVSVSKAFKSPISPKTVVAVSVPLRRQGAIAHVLRAILLTETLDRLLLDEQLPAGWVAAITDSHGTLLARSTAAESYVGKPAAPSFLEGIRRGDGHPFDGTTLEGERATLMVLPLHGGDWYLGIAVPNAKLGAGLRQAVRLNAWLAGLGVGVALVLSYLCSAYLLAQVRILVGALTEQPSNPANDEALKVAELQTILDSVRSASRREMEATGSLSLALTQRDEIADLYDHAPCGYHSLDAAGRLVRMNKTALDWLGYAWEELRGKHFTELLAPESRVTFAANFPRFLAEQHIENVEITLVRKDGSTMPVAVTASAVCDESGKFLWSRSTTFDLTERKRLEAQLDHLARTDALTGLSNRRDFYEQAGRELQRCQRSHKPLALLVLDIDHFKQVNDIHGHQSGDRVLQAVANEFKTVLRRSDLVARVGGEEFAALLPETSPELALEIAERLRQAVEAFETALPSGTRLSVTASIGVANHVPADLDLDKTMARADAALYASKNAGRNRVSVSGAMPASTGA